MKGKSLSCVRLLATPWTTAHQAPPSMGLSPTNVCLACAHRKGNWDTSESASEVKVAQLYLTLCHPMGYTVHGILQARILEWVAIPFSSGHILPVLKKCSSVIQGLSLSGEGNGIPLQYSCLENPWTEEPGRLQSMGSLRVGHN